MPNQVRSRRMLGRTGIAVGPLSFGSAPLSSVFWGNDADTAIATGRRAVEVGIGLFDTAPLYGLGEAEERLGVALDGVGDIAIATKAGRSLVDGPDGRDIRFDFSADATRRQLDASLRRLRRDRVDIVHVHDPEDHLGEALQTCLPTLVELRDEGVIGAVSIGTTSCATVLHVLDHAEVDAIMLAGRLTLLDHSAVDEVVPACIRLGVPLLAAGVFNSGVLARPRVGSWYDYAPADDRVLARVDELQARCDELGVSLRGAAMAFPLQFAPVATVVVGMASPAEVDENVALIEADLPDDLWTHLDLDVG
jgi:aryl-alcohol dehydrogenase-like predicted oxidoreductase